MLASHDWRLRHAGLMAIAAIAEGTSKVMQQELGKVIEYVPLSLVYSALPHSFPSREDWSSRCSTTHIHACDMRHASACTSPHLVLLPTLTLTATRTHDSGQLCTDLEVRTACVIGF